MATRQFWIPGAGLGALTGVGLLSWLAPADAKLLVGVAATLTVAVLARHQLWFVAGFLIGCGGIVTALMLPLGMAAHVPTMLFGVVLLAAGIVLIGVRASRSQGGA